MRLKDSYYQIVRETVEGREGRFRIRLLSDCPVYRGHFPGNPVSPGGRGGASIARGYRFYGGGEDDGGGRYLRGIHGRDA